MSSNNKGTHKLQQGTDLKWKFDWKSVQSLCAVVLEGV